jgi:N-acetylgalactosamine-N,N'-diacetylbacillosaminyl-diphospho-undecaprenol 4-alpha-N-acetylgalactosaminyltransferase
MNRLKIILLVNQLGNGGAERVVSLLAKHLSKENNQIEVICLERNLIGTENFYQISSDIPIHYLTNDTKTHSGLHKLIELPILGWKLMRYVQQNNIQLVQSHLFRASYVNTFAKLWAQMLGKRKHKMQFVTPGQVTYYDKKGLLGKINIALIRFCYPRADYIVFKSIEMQAQATQRIPALAPCPQTVIYNPYDIEAIQAQTKAEVDFYFNPDKRYLISVGRLIKLKRTEIILNALTHLPNDIELILVGNGTEEADFKRLAEQLNVRQRVHFVGSQKNPFAYLNKSNLFVMASETEGFPNVLVEAMLCGIPVIASDCISGPREILAPTTNPLKHLSIGDHLELAKYGILTPVGDVQGLVLAIQHLLNEPEKAKQLADAAYQRATDFSLKIIISRYQDIMHNTP